MPDNETILLTHEAAVGEADERHLAAIVASSDDAILSKDLTGRILTWNAAAERLYGYLAAEAIGRNIGFIVPMDRQTEVAEILKKIQRGTSVSHHETVRIRKGGERIVVSLTVSPIYGPAGEIVAASAIARDITEQTRAACALQENAEIMREVFEFSPDAVAVVNAEGEIVCVNPRTEQMFGYPRDELLGERIEMLIPERFRERHLSHRENYMNLPRTRPMGAGLELLGRHHDGSEFPVDIMLSPITTSKATRVIAVVRDVTARRQAEQHVENLEREVLMNREIHHRVKNNLQIISSLLFLQSMHVSDERTREVLRESQSRAHSLALIHEKLYGSSYVAAIAFADYARQLAGDMFKAYRASGDRVRLEVMADEIFLGIDTAIPCGLIITELISNALKYAFPCGRGGKITIAFEHTDANRLKLTVRDDGVGLPEGFNLEEAQTLGLKLVRDLTRQLGGTLEYKNEHGTVVEIRFVDTERGAHSLH